MIAKIVEGKVWYDRMFHFTIEVGKGIVLGRGRKMKTSEECEKDIQLLNDYFNPKVKVKMLTLIIVKHGWLRQKYHFQFVNIDDDVVCWSENYFNRKDCMDAVDAIKGSIDKIIIIRK